MTKEWLVNTLNAVVLAFLSAFTGSLVAGGAGLLSVTVLHAAAIAGLGAALVTVQAAVAQLVPGKNPTASLPRALVAAGRSASPPAGSHFAPSDEGPKAVPPPG